MCYDRHWYTGDHVHKPLPKQADPKPREFYDPPMKVVCPSCGERYWASREQCVCGTLKPKAK